MSLDIIRDIWDGLHSHINYTERKDAADMLVNLLIDNDYEADEIKDAFKGDKDVLSALKFYQEQNDINEDPEEFEDEDDEW